MTPKQIVQELDRYIVGQYQAKKAVAVALRNRYRRSKLSKHDMEEITPKNIIMKGPTGVGKTEIARRLAKLVKAPFLKVEATKYTEVGFVGRDVESMIRDLVEVSIRLVKDERYRMVEPKAFQKASERVADLISKQVTDLPEGITKETLVDEVAKHNLDQLTIAIKVQDNPKGIEIPNSGGQEINLGSIFGDMMPKKTKTRSVTVSDALRIYTDEECAKLIDLDSVNDEALRRAENDGVIFIDEIDKIASKGNTNGPDVSREGVQRDILPIVEGCTVTTKYGNIKTDYILFIASGAFHISKVGDLIPELQGRFPVVVDLTSLGVDEFVSILTEPENAVTRQYAKLLAVDNIDLQFTEDGILEIAKVAYELNTTREDIGARRLHSIMEHITEDISYEADGTPHTVVIDSKYVADNFTDLSTRNLKKYIL